MAFLWAFPRTHRAHAWRTPTTTKPPTPTPLQTRVQRNNARNKPGRRLSDVDAAWASPAQGPPSPSPSVAVAAPAEKWSRLWRALEREETRGRGGARAGLDRASAKSSWALKRNGKGPQSTDAAESPVSQRPNEVVRTAGYPLFVLFWTLCP